MAINVNDIWKVVYRCKAPLDSAVNVRHFKVSAVVGVPTYQMAADGIFNQFAVAYQGVMSVAASFDYVAVQHILPEPAGDTSFSSIAPVNGSNVSDLLPRQTCGIITLRTGIAGVKFRGRVYAPFPPESANDSSGQPNAGYLTNLDALATLFDDVLTITVGADSLGLTPVVYHRSDDTTTPITVAVSRPRWATQRRRNNNRFA